jgi:hypothetical protein
MVAMAQIANTCTARMLNLLLVELIALFHSLALDPASFERACV